MPKKKKDEAELPLAKPGKADQAKAKGEKAAGASGVAGSKPAPEAPHAIEAEKVAAPAPAPTPAPAPATVSRPVPPAEATVGVAGDVALDASANAPFIYFENAGVSGHMNGVVRVTLEAARVLPGENNTVYVDRVIVGHLRMNLPAAQSLRNALDRALLLASKPASREMN